MRLTTAQKWRKTIAWLRRNFPSRYPVVVRSVPLKIHGDTDYEKNKFLVRINSKKSHSARIDTILHEWAHVLTWFGAGHYEDHPDEWGLCWGKIYRTFVEWNYGRNVSDTQN